MQSAEPVPPVSTANPEPTPDSRILLELIQSYRRPAALVNDAGEVLCVSDAGVREGDDDAAVPSAEAWHRHAKIFVGDQVFHLTLPPGEASVPADAHELQLPPRLAKIARLVIAGCTDKQIASRTGLSYATVRTYVRQVYRHTGVHSRVELVHASRGRAIGG